jgi:hypothetical protein
MEELESISTIVQPNGILQQAKEMEKEQIIDAFQTGDSRLNAHQYYNETFKK